MSDHEIPPIPEIPSVPFEVHISAGEPHRLDLVSTVPQGTERVYFNNAIRGLVLGLSGTGERLTDLLPDDGPIALQIAKAGEAVLRD